MMSSQYVDAPNQIWETGLNRMLETLVGALSALLVTSLFWPRYAREEFFGGPYRYVFPPGRAGRSALQTASQLLSIETDAYVHGQKVSGGLWDFHPAIDWFWVRTGIKGGLASVISILLLRWINPPGATIIPLTAWVFTILSRPFVRVGGAGDLRIIQRVFVAGLLFIPTVALLRLDHACSGKLNVAAGPVRG